MADDKGRGGGLVDNAPIRAAIEEVVASGRRTWSDIAINAGMTNRRPKRGAIEEHADTTRLKRRLGMKPDGYGRTQTQLRLGIALSIIEAAGLDPVDCDL